MWCCGHCRAAVGAATLGHVTWIWGRERLAALCRGIGLYGLSLAALVVAIGHILFFIPGLGLGMVFLLPWPIMWGRRFTDLARRLTLRWTDVDAPAQYVPKPERPQRG